MSEFFKPAGQWIAQNVPLTVIIVLLLLSIFFKIPKKEVRVFSWLLAKLGNVLLADVRKDIQDLKEDNATKFEELTTDTDKRISELEAQTNASFDAVKIQNMANCSKMQDRLDEIERKQDFQAMARIRASVLNFSDDLRRGNERTKEDYDNILNEDKEYEQIVAKYNEPNNVYTHALKFINDKYDHNMKNDGFAKY